MMMIEGFGCSGSKASDKNNERDLRETARVRQDSRDAVEDREEGVRRGGRQEAHSRDVSIPMVSAREG
ncbi:unnamed protein product [Anisakis simplex]|uniref:Uncharacterized protein n=1 Tax=Anisakis simplex TaxID=6269 RepID=A0A0M3JGU8_ANISI|nr:unnamed protein product [Anisakis simplex]